MISVMQCLKAISITGGQPTTVPPLMFVVAVSMIKDCLEDRKRRQADDEENNSTGIRLKNLKGPSRSLD
jgi:phospholipid-transporting ATPase